MSSRDSAPVEQEWGSSRGVSFLLHTLHAQGILCARMGLEKPGMPGMRVFLLLAHPCGVNPAWAAGMAPGALCARHSWQPSRPPASHSWLLPAWTLLLPLPGCSSSPCQPALDPTVLCTCVGTKWPRGILAWILDGCLANSRENSWDSQSQRLGWHRAGPEAPPALSVLAPRGISLPEQQQLSPCIPPELPNPSFFHEICDSSSHSSPVCPCSQLSSVWFPFLALLALPGLVPPQRLLVAAHSQPRGACGAFSRVVFPGRAGGSCLPRPAGAGPCPTSSEQGTDSGGNSDLLLSLHTSPGRP